MEADLYVSGERAQPTFFGAGTLFFEAEQVVPERPDLTRLPAELRERVTFDPQTNTLAVERALTEQDRAALEQCFTTPEARQAVEDLLPACRTAEPSRRMLHRKPAAHSGCPCWQSGWTASLSYSRKAIFSTRLGGFRSVTPA